MQVKGYIMSKVKIRLKINDLEEQINGIFHDNYLIFFLNKKKVTLMLKENMITMKKMENEHEYTYLKFHPDYPEAYYFFHQKYPMNIQIDNLQIKPQKMRVNYRIEEQSFLFEIEYEEGEI